MSSNQDLDVQMPTLEEVMQNAQRRKAAGRQQRLDELGRRDGVQVEVGEPQFTRRPPADLSSPPRDLSRMPPLSQREENELMQRQAPRREPVMMPPMDFSQQLGRGQAPQGEPVRMPPMNISPRQAAPPQVTEDEIRAKVEAGQLDPRMLRLFQAYQARQAEGGRY